ncbi:AAA family ATPase [Microbacterium sp. BH-3-3-3]|uniref:AAA family ATPase n=1 Tax=Microbacterium sp. BH-3-3-3 TaxID=1906742 RepID=UPI0011A8E568|nr:AAA family ATPase [Microbacterium sp. BH-3-3-3]
MSLVPRSRSDVEADFSVILDGIRRTEDPARIEAAAHAAAMRVPSEYIVEREVCRRIVDAAPEMEGDELRAAKKAAKRGYRHGALSRAIRPLETPSKLLEALEYQGRKNRERERRQIARELNDEGNDRPPVASAMLDYAALMDRPPLHPLVPDVLNLDTVAMLYAPPATFKTFLALWLAACVALGHSWAGRPVDQGPVLYIAAEGVAGIQKRVAALAWQLNGGKPIPDFFIYPEPVNLTSDADVAELTELVRERGFRFVILDTLVKVAGGAEENDNTAMTRVTNAAEQIKRAGEGKTSVLLVHHSGKSGDYRGASALEGNVDTVLKLAGEAGMLTLTAVKQKDGTDGEIAQLRAERIEEHDTLVLKAVAPGEGSPSGKQAARLEETLAHFTRAYGSTGITRSEFVQNLVEWEVGSRSAAQTYVGDLINAGRLKSTRKGQGTWLTLPTVKTFPLNKGDEA